MSSITQCKLFQFLIFFFLCDLNSTDVSIWHRRQRWIKYLSLLILHCELVITFTTYRLVEFFSSNFDNFVASTFFSLHCEAGALFTFHADSTEFLNTLRKRNKIEQRAYWFSLEWTIKSCHNNKLSTVCKIFNHCFKITPKELSFIYAYHIKIISNF